MERSRFKPRPCTFFFSFFRLLCQQVRNKPSWRAHTCDCRIFTTHTKLLSLAWKLLATFAPSPSDFITSWPPPIDFLSSLGIYLTRKHALARIASDTVMGDECKKPRQNPIRISIKRERGYSIARQVDTMPGSVFYWSTWRDFVRKWNCMRSGRNHLISCSQRSACGGHMCVRPAARCCATLLCVVQTFVHCLSFLYPPSYNRCSRIVCVIG